MLKGDFLTQNNLGMPQPYRLKNAQNEKKIYNNMDL